MDLDFQVTRHDSVGEKASLYKSQISDYPSELGKVKEEVVRRFFNLAGLKLRSLKQELNIPSATSAISTTKDDHFRNII